MVECRAEADTVMRKGKPVNWIAAAIIVAIWLLLAGLAIWGVVVL
jgi:hypothetical protein